MDPRQHRSDFLSRDSTIGKEFIFQVEFYEFAVFFGLLQEGESLQ